MKHLLALCILVLLPLSAACVMPGDLAAIQSNLDAYSAGSISKTTFDENNVVIQEKIDERGESIEAGAMGFLDVLIPGLGSLAVGGIALYKKTKADAVVQVNHDRDQKYVIAHSDTVPPVVS